jgi:predicted AAA+ superfamily ATPase
LDLLWVRGGQRWGFEVKYADAPRTTKSMRSAMESLRLERLFVIYPGAMEYELDEGISVLPLAEAGRLPDRMKPGS